MEKILFVDACVRPDSRTRRLARNVLDMLSGDITELRLYDEKLPPLDLAALEQRERCVRAQDFSDSAFRFAKQFAAADTIVIAAPFWDFLFPAVLRIYLETVTVVGLTLQYTPEGVPQGLCRAKRLIYVTTAGGPIGDFDFGYRYVKALAQNFYGIGDVRCVAAECLDIVGADVEAIMEKAGQHAAEVLRP